MVRFSWVIVDVNTFVLIISKRSLDSRRKQEDGQENF